MAGAKTTYTQDMPPPGGYERIFYQRTFAKVGVKWWKVILYGGTAWITSLCCHRALMRQRRINLLEDNDVRLALQPFLCSERDREWLKLMKKNRDIENEVMKDVPGWKTGTWYGEPVYFTIPKDKWWDPQIPEPFVHLRWRDIEKWANWREHDEYAGPHWYDKYLPEFVNDWVR